ncbi:hypothetical protein AB6D67_07080 [Vibrio splendidus]
MANSKKEISSVKTKSEVNNVILFLSIWVLSLVITFGILMKFDLLHPLSLFSVNAFVFVIFAAIGENFPKLKVVKWIALAINVILLVVAIATLPSEGAIKAVDSYDGPKTIWSDIFNK